MTGAARRVTEIEELYLRCGRDWRTLFFELESGEGSLLSEDPWSELDVFVRSRDESELAALKTTLAEMIGDDVREEQAQALSILAAVPVEFDLAQAVTLEAQIRDDLEAHAALLLAIGQRQYQAGIDVVRRALDQPTRRHAALIALAQLDPEEASVHGREVYQADRDRMQSLIHRPLGENEYVTFYEMARGALQLHGKDGLNRFLRGVAHEDKALAHELAQLARRVFKQSHAEEPD